MIAHPDSTAITTSHEWYDVNVQLVAGSPQQKVIAEREAVVSSQLTIALGFKRMNRERLLEGEVATPGFFQRRRDRDRDSCKGRV